MILTDEQLNEKIAKAKGYTPKLCPCGCGTTGWQTKYALIFRDWANEWRDAGELLEEVVKDGINSYTLYCDGGGYYSCEIRIAGDKRVTFCEADTPQRAICEAWLKWKGIEI